MIASEGFLSWRHVGRDVNWVHAPRGGARVGAIRATAAVAINQCEFDEP